MAVACLCLPLGAPGASVPSIDSIQFRGGNVVVSVSIPAGLTQVTLESRGRIDAGTWIPAAVLHASGAATNIDFTLPRSQSLQVLRVAANPTAPLPGSFYQGTNQFTGPASVSNPASSPAGSTLSPGVATTTTTATTSTTGAAVVESDIWEFSGNTLFFFNQQRGLQVIDITQPESPVLRWTLPLPAVGEQMYLLDTNLVVLLAQNNCGNGNSNDVLVVRLTDQGPVVQSRVSLEGSWSDSRMVGDVLYMASEAYYALPSTNGEWVWGTVVSSVDLSDPARPVVADTRQVNGYGNLVYATDDYFFVVTADYDYYTSTVYPFDISDSSGLMAPLPQVHLPGMVENKYNLNFQAGVFSAVHTYPDSANWDYWSTTLENFELGPAGSFARVGGLVLARGNQLQSSRFDGTKAYVVTGDQTSPLWVVDNSNPASPVVAGKVQIAGWSSFIVPLGGRLVTIGVQSNMVAVSLFDVSQPSLPALLDDVVLGNQFSWSFANWDDKSFNVLPGAGLILVPYEGYGSNGFSSQVQLIDLGSNSLALRGVVSHPMQPERTAVVGGSILALSDEDLISVDATNRDEPVVQTDLNLAWDASAVIPAGNFIVQVSENDPGAPVLRVTSGVDTATVLGELTLTNLPVIGVAARAGYAYIAQAPSPFYEYPLPVDGGGSPASANGYSMVLSVIDLTRAPALQVAGQVVVTNAPQSWGYSLEPLWLGTNLLVWAGNEPMFLPMMADPGIAGGTASLFFPWWGSAALTAFDISKAEAPCFASQTQINTNGWGFGKSFAVGNLVYASYQSSYMVTNSWSTNSAGTNGVPVPQTYWFTENILQVIDFTDSANPTPRNPVLIPNSLVGVSPDGSILYTEGPHLNPSNYFDWSQTFVDASAYDGASAYLLDSLELTNSWPVTWLATGSNMLVGNPGAINATNNTTQGELGLWALSAAGKFALQSSLALNEPVQSLKSFDSGLVLGQGSDGSLMAFDLSQPQVIRQVLETNLDSCLWFNLSAVAGSRAAGLWIPFGAYGVGQVTLPP